MLDPVTDPTASTETKLWLYARAQEALPFFCYCRFAGSPLSCISELCLVILYLVIVYLHDDK